MSVRILLPFNDDSTLFFAVRMRDLLANEDCEVTTAWLTNESPLSYRQLEENLPNGPDCTMLRSFLSNPENLSEFDAIVVSRIFSPLRDLMRRQHIRLMRDRPAVISFQGGLDFTPEIGFANRKHADAVFVVPKSDVDAFEAYRTAKDFGWQHVAFGHPTFVRPDAPPDPDRARQGDIYFFAQAISPLSLESRRHIVDMLAAIAERNPDRTVYIKLRHLPHENQRHLHTERHDYPGIIDRWRGTLPDNLKITACTMDEALANASIGITCTSTAAIDLVRAGVPTQIYLDYVENYLDPLAAPMRALFEDSDLIRPLDEVLNLVTRPPSPDWVDNMFCPPDLGKRVLDAIRTVQDRPIQVDRVLHRRAPH